MGMNLGKSMIIYISIFETASTPFQMIVDIRQYLPRKSRAQELDVPTKLRERSWMPSSLQRVDGSLVTSLGELAKPSQPWQGRKHTVGCLSASIGGGVQWTFRLSNPIQMTHELSNKSPVPNAICNTQIALVPFGLNRLVSGPLSQTTKPNSLGKRTISIQLSSFKVPRITDYAEVGKWKGFLKSSELQAMFVFSGLFSHFLFSMFALVSVAQGRQEDAYKISA